MEEMKSFDPPWRHQPKSGFNVFFSHLHFANADLRNALLDPFRRSWDHLAGKATREKIDIGHQQPLRPNSTHGIVLVILNANITSYDERNSVAGLLSNDDMNFAQLWRQRHDTSW